MRKGWEVKLLGSVCENLDSQRKPITQRNRIAGDIPYYGAMGVVDYVKDYIFNEKLVLLGEDGAKWKSGDECAFIIEGKTWVNNHAHVLLPNRKVLLDEWLVYNLNFQDLSPFISGMTVPKLNQGRMNEIKIPVPPLPEQKRIVEILDEAFAAIDKAKINTEKNLQNAKELFESYLQNVFANGEWDKKPVCEISENLDGKRIPVTQNKRKKGDIPYYGASGIVDYVEGFIFNEDLLLVSEDGANLLMRTYPIAFSISGKTWVNNHAHVLRFKNRTSQIFVEYYLNSIKLDKYVSGMAQPKLNQKMLNSIPMPFPDLKVQEQVVKQLDILSSETKKLETIYQQKLNDLEELKKSILQKAFNGELTAAVVV